MRTLLLVRLRTFVATASFAFIYVILGFFMVIAHSLNQFPNNLVDHPIEKLIESVVLRLFNEANSAKTVSEIASVLFKNGWLWGAYISIPLVLIHWKLTRKP